MTKPSAHEKKNYLLKRNTRRPALPRSSLVNSVPLEHTMLQGQTVHLKFKQGAKAEQCIFKELIPTLKAQNGRRGRRNCLRVAIGMNWSMARILAQSRSPILSGYEKHWTMQGVLVFSFLSLSIFNHFLGPHMVYYSETSTWHHILSQPILYINFYTWYMSYIVYKRHFVVLSLEKCFITVWGTRNSAYLEYRGLKNFPSL